MFASEHTIYFVEQKVRDDHDSSKKRGQIDNFEKKISVILEDNIGKSVEGFCYFIDANFTKNKNFYQAESQKLSKDYGITLHLSYGNDLFAELDKIEVWAEILSHLRTWKSNIPDLPEINFDLDPQVSFEEIKDLQPMIYRKLFANSELDDLLCVLFSKQATLRLLVEYFKNKCIGGDGMKIYATLATSCNKAMERIAGFTHNVPSRAY